MGKERKWILKEPADPEKVGRLSAELGIDRVLADLLVKRGVETFEQARSFFRPSLNDLHDPFLMKDMDKAVARIYELTGATEKAAPSASRTDAIRTLLLLIAALGMVYLILQPSYLPKGHIERSEAPPPPVASAASAQIQDRTSKPMPLAERDQKLREDVQRGLDFQHPAK